MKNTMSMYLKNILIVCSFLYIILFVVNSVTFLPLYPLLLTCGLDEEIHSIK